MTNPVFTGRGGISAQVVAHSAHPLKGGKSLFTLQLRYPRFIHAELMTHRVFSRNASSSRAIPVAKMIEQVRNNPAMPIHWGKNQPGMQAREELNETDKRRVQQAWYDAAIQSSYLAEYMNKCGAHKQVVNRILEPFQFMHVIVTSTEWQNFFELRDHEDAEPNIDELAKTMKRAMLASTPDMLSFGDWHLPYVRKEELKKHGIEICRKLSAARCARVSYLTHDGREPDVEKDIELFERLVGSVPLHASPIEHQATPDPDTWPGTNRHLWGNLSHWVQFRKLYEQKFATEKENQP